MNDLFHLRPTQTQPTNNDVANGLHGLHSRLWDLADDARLRPALRRIVVDLAEEADALGVAAVQVARRKSGRPHPPFPVMRDQVETRYPGFLVRLQQEVGSQPRQRMRAVETIRARIIAAWGDLAKDEQEFAYGLRE